MTLLTTLEYVDSNGLLNGVVYEGVDQGTRLVVDGFGNNVPYRDLEPGSTVPGAKGRMVSVHEQAQPHIWAFRVHHVAPTRKMAIALSIQTDTALIGWVPSSNSGPISQLYFQVYDDAGKRGDRVAHIATRFYETQLGTNPDMNATNTPTPVVAVVIGAGASEVHAQIFAATTWYFTHNLGRLPVVEVYDLSGNVVMADVVSSTTDVTITFSNQQTGRVVLS